MSLRISHGYSFQQFLTGLTNNQVSLTRSQAQISSGLRLLKPSDDPTGAARVITLRSRLAHTGAYQSSASSGKSLVDFSASALQDSSELMTDLRATLIQALNGTLSEEDRAGLSAEVGFLRDQLLELANSELSGHYVFGGTATGSPPWQETSAGGVKHVVYKGNAEQQEVPLGTGVNVGLNLGGLELFAQNEASGTVFSGSTGVQGGTTADMGTGFSYLDIQHAATALAGLATDGITAVNGGGDDTFLGDHSVVVDAVAGTVQLAGGGPPVLIPAAGSPEAADVVVTTADGGELHLDFSAWTGASVTGTASGSGSVRFGGGPWQPLDPLQTDQAFEDPNTGSVVHLDLSGVNSAGQEVVTFGGAINVFDALQVAADALSSDSGLAFGELQERLNLALAELDRHQDNVLVGVGVLGSRSARLSNTMERLQGQELDLQDRISQIRDVDFSQAVLELTKAEQRLQLVQMSGTKMISNSLLNFMR